MVIPIAAAVAPAVPKSRAIPSAGPTRRGVRSPPLVYRNRRAEAHRRRSRMGPARKSTWIQGREPSRRSPDPSRRRGQVPHGRPVARRRRKMPRRRRRVPHRTRVPREPAVRSSVLRPQRHRQQTQPNRDRSHRFHSPKSTPVFDSLAPSKLQYRRISARPLVSQDAPRWQDAHWTQN
jgi:hypothetical protein